MSFEIAGSSLSAFYMSPEMIKAEKEATFSTDMWSLGCILFEMCSLQKAYLVDEGNTMQLLSKIVDGPVPSLPDQYSDDLKEIYSALMQKLSLIHI